MIELQTTRDGRTIHVRSSHSFVDVLASWAVDPSLWMAILTQAPFEAAAWECPPLTDLDRPFECVVLDHPTLARLPLDRSSFAEHFVAGRDAVTFPNLRGDSDLVAPCPKDDRTSPHLLAWARHASSDEARALWSLVLQTLQARLGPRPTWLSTAGMGVGWLHVRMDPRPKYYRYRPYREAP